MQLRSTLEAKPFCTVASGCVVFLLGFLFLVIFTLINFSRRALGQADGERAALALAAGHADLAVVQLLQVVSQHVKLAHDFGPLLKRLGYEHVEHVWQRRLDAGTGR